MSGPRVRVSCDGVRYHIRWFCENSDDWYERLDDFKYEFEPWERRFEPRTRTWSVPLAYRARVRAWADRWFDAEPTNGERIHRYRSHTMYCSWECARTAPHRRAGQSTVHRVRHDRRLYVARPFRIVLPLELEVAE